MALKDVFEFIKKPYITMFSMGIKQPRLIELEERLEKTRALDDVAERILAAEKLHKDAIWISIDLDLDVHPLRYMPSIVPVGIVAGAVISPFIAMPVAACIGFGAIYGFVAASLTGFASIGVLEKKDRSYKVAEDVQEACSSIIAAAPNAENFLSISQSPHFESIMNKFPKLKDSFLLASAREQLAQGHSSSLAVEPLDNAAGQMGLKTSQFSKTGKGFNS